MITEYYDLVKKILEETPLARDKDCFLVSLIWHYELKGIDDKNTILLMLGRGDLSNYESIGRARRKCQELNPHLRGTRWNQRHEVLEDEVKKDLKVIESSFHQQFGDNSEVKDGDLFKE